MFFKVGDVLSIITQGLQKLQPERNRVKIAKYI